MLPTSGKNSFHFFPTSPFSSRTLLRNKTSGGTFLKPLYPSSTGKSLMRSLVFVVAAAAFFVLPTSAFSQSIQIGPGGVRVDDGWGRGGQCEELRRACENKDRLGEQGEGNCRRYREACQRPVRRDVCSELRAACLNKDQLGEQGEDNCHRYRQTCRGR
jgi:hypothetical protein